MSEKRKPRGQRARGLSVTTPRAPHALDTRSSQGRDIEPINPQLVPELVALQYVLTHGKEFIHLDNKSPEIDYLPRVDIEPTSASPFSRANLERVTGLASLEAKVRNGKKGVTESQNWGAVTYREELLPGYADLETAWENFPKQGKEVGMIYSNSAASTRESGGQQFTSSPHKTVNVFCGNTPNGFADFRVSITFPDIEDDDRLRKFKGGTLLSIHIKGRSGEIGLGFDEKGKRFSERDWLDFRGKVHDGYLPVDWERLDSRRGIFQRLGLRR